MPDWLVTVGTFLGLTAATMIAMRWFTRSVERRERRESLQSPRRLFPSNDNWRTMDDVEWKPAVRLFPVRLIDGTRGAGHLYRRVIKGQPQFRRETKSEAEERFANEAW